MKADEYKVLCHAVEEGVAYGWNRAHKYKEKADAETVKDTISQHVIAEICEWFDFEPLKEEKPCSPE